MNNIIAYALAVLFLIIGGVLLMYRLLYMFCQGQPWNNPPTSLYWVFTFVLTGPAILLTLVLVPRCGNECPRDANTGLYGFLFIVAILLIAGPFLVYQCMDRCQASEQDKNKNKNQGGAGEDGPRSGFDILLLMVGGGVLLADMAVGACPESC